MTNHERRTAQIADAGFEANPSRFISHIFISFLSVGSDSICARAIRDPVTFAAYGARQIAVCPAGKLD
jgi:hypothetical protein